MYTRRLWIVLIAALVFPLALAACGDDEEADKEALRGSGNIVTEEMPFADFTSLDVRSAFDAHIVQSETFAVTIRVDDNILDLVDVSKEGDTLTIGLERSVRLTGDVTLEADITMPDLDDLKLSGAARANLSGFSSSDELEIDLSGASNLDGDLEAGEVDIEASGASRIVLEGSATELIIEGSGASSLDLADFTADTADVRLSGASDATVNVQERIDSADVSGASRLRYLGDPELDDVTSSGASTIEKVGD